MQMDLTRAGHENRHRPARQSGAPAAAKSSGERPRWIRVRRHRAVSDPVKASGGRAVPWRPAAALELCTCGSERER